MAAEARPELVGKRFLCVSGDEPPGSGDIIGRWPWRSGVIRAVSHRDNDNPDLTVRPDPQAGPLQADCYMQSEMQNPRSVAGLVVVVVVVGGWGTAEDPVRDSRGPAGGQQGPGEGQQRTR